MEACKDWPKTELLSNYYDPFRIEIPIVVVSTEADPASSRSRWDREIASIMPNSVHIIVPGVGHPADNDCLQSIRYELFRSGMTKKLDTSCTKNLKHPSFKLSAQ
jgi:hypothetical protein